MRYIPISLVSTLEGYFRAVVRDLVDFNLVFLERVEKFRELKVSMNIVTAVHGKKLTLDSSYFIILLVIGLKGGCLYGCSLGGNKKVRDESTLVVSQKVEQYDAVGLLLL